MAFIADDDKELAEESGTQGQQVGGGSSTDVGSGQVSTAGVGPGGTGAWTNIQAYLNANKGDTGSAQALGATVGQQFNTERDQMKAAGDKILGEGNKAVSDNYFDSNRADNLIKQGQDSFSWSNQSDPYKESVNQIRTALTNNYSGPKDFSYGISDQTQSYGTALKDQGGFDQLMNQMYQKSAGGPLSYGQNQLQKQLDVNNVGLSEARKNLSGQYDALGAERDSYVNSTNTSLADLGKKWTDNQKSLSDYLGKKSNEYNSQISGLENDARRAYRNSFENDDIFKGQSAQDLVNIMRGERYNLWKDDQLMDFDGRLAEEYGPVAPTLSRFYRDQDRKYANTADQEERAFNALQDFLGIGGGYKKQGFSVR